MVKIFPVVALAAISLSVALPTAAATTWQPFTFGQFLAQSDGDDDGLSFDAGAVRVGFSARSGAFGARLQLDLNAGDLDERPPGTLPNVIKDVYATYALDSHHELRFGQFKAPLGYDFSLSGASLDIAKRGLEKGLVLERALGVMFSGRKLAGGFGYDIGVFNPAGRSSATAHIGSGVDDQTGKDLAAAARVYYAPDEHWHAELAYGRSQDAGGPGTQDYDVLDAALRWRRAPWTLKAEYIGGTDLRGVPGRDARVWYAHAGYDFSPRLTGVLRHYEGDSEVGRAETGLRNTWVGLTFFFDPDNRRNARLMLNYVFTGGDGGSYSGPGGVRDDTLLAQFQFHFQGN